jgi:hypothetical protein
MVDLKTFQGYIRERSSLMSSREEVYAVPGDDENVGDDHEGCGRSVAHLVDREEREEMAISYEGLYKRCGGNGLLILVDVGKWRMRSAETENVHLMRVGSREKRVNMSTRPGGQQFLTIERRMLMTTSKDLSDLEL